MLIVQTRPDNTDANIVFSPLAGQFIILTLIIVCNVSSSKARYSIFVNKQTKIFDESTAIVFNAPVVKSDGYSGRELTLDDETFNLAIQTSIADALTFSIWGIVKRNGEL